VIVQSDTSFPSWNICSYSWDGCCRALWCSS